MGNPDAPTSSRMQPTWVMCGQTKMYPHLPGSYPHQSHVGEPRCPLIFPNATHIGPMWDFIWAPSGISTLLHPALTWVPCGKTQMHPHLPGCNPHGSCVGKPRCTHIYPGVTHINPIWANPDAPLSSRTHPHWSHDGLLYGPQVGFPHFCTQYAHGSRVGKPKCPHIYPNGPQMGFPHGTNMDLAPSIHMGPLWANPDAPTSTWMQPISFPSGQTQIHPHLPR